MKQLLPILILLTGCELSFAQEVTIKVTGAQDKRPLAYVNIHLDSTGFVGTTNEQGHFRLNLSKANGDANISLSLIGYEQKTVSINDFLAASHTGDNLIELKEQNFLLEEITIRPIAVTSYSVGNSLTNFQQRQCTPFFMLIDSLYRSKKGFQSYPLQQTKRFEVGTLLKPRNGRTSFIDKVEIQFCIGKFDSLKLRLNVYSSLDSIVSNGVFREYFQYKSINRKPIYFTIYGAFTDYILDLTRQNIHVTDDFILTIETLRPEDYQKVVFPIKASPLGSPMVFILPNRSSLIQLPLIKMNCKVYLSTPK